MSGAVVSESKLSITGIVASRNSTATSLSTVLNAIGEWPRLSKAVAISRTYNSEPARFARVLLVINILRPRIVISERNSRELQQAERCVRGNGSLGDSNLALPVSLHTFRRRAAPELARLLDPRCRSDAGLRAATQRLLPHW